MQQDIGEVQFFGRLLVQQALMKLLGKFHFQGFFLASSYWGSPTLGFFCNKLLGKVAFVASSYATSFWEIVGVAPFFGSNPLGNSHLWIFFCSKLLGKSPFWPFCCFKLLGNFHLQRFFCIEARREFRIAFVLREAIRGFRLRIVDLLQPIDGLRFRIICYLKHAPSPHLAISVHHIS